MIGPVLRVIAFTLYNHMVISSIDNCHIRPLEKIDLESVCLQCESLYSWSRFRNLMDFASGILFFRCHNLLFFLVYLIKVVAAIYRAKSIDGVPSLFASGYHRHNLNLPLSDRVLIWCQWTDIPFSARGSTLWRPGAEHWFLVISADVPCSIRHDHLITSVRCL